MGWSACSNKANRHGPIVLRARILKRAFDVILSTLGICLTWWLLIPACLAASIDTRQPGLFLQKRIGHGGKAFTVAKLRTMRTHSASDSTITASGDPRITRLGRVLRRTKLDELPQLFNILFGQMSFVGPRPDVAGYADRLVGEDRIILSVRPGITGPATLKYRNEEEILAAQKEPTKYNDEVIYPDKVRINKAYVLHYSFDKDIRYLLQTLVGR
jgi:lipopolysaccharide/colanic/teichoic acid biosynthesis glycosyltransferase